MKRALIFFISLSTLPLSVVAMHTSIPPTTFHTLSALNASAEKLFGYNPTITASDNVSQESARSRVALLCLPGAGNGTGEKYKHALPGSKNYVSVIPNWTHNICQGGMPTEKEAHLCTQVGLFTLNHLHSLGYKTVLFGHSFGGAIALKMIDCLNHPQEYLPSCTQLDLTRMHWSFNSCFPWIDCKKVADEQRIATIKESILKVLLDKPVVKNPYLRPQDDFFGHQKAERHEMDPLDYMIDSGTPLSIVLANNDTVVGNEWDSDIIRRVGSLHVDTVQEDHNDIDTNVRKIEELLPLLALPAQ